VLDADVVVRCFRKKMSINKREEEEEEEDKREKEENEEY